MPETERRIKRDVTNASEAKRRASVKLSNPNTAQVLSSAMFDAREMEAFSLRCIASNAFHAMVEVELETTSGEVIKEHLLYSHVDTKNNIILSGDNGYPININVWTHPAIQIGLNMALKEPHDITSGRYTILSVRPLARGKFKQIEPTIVGIYEPGGSVGEPDNKEAGVGLKAVKLDMTRDQIDAFLSKMDGVIFITGAPGSGKTTVALQRIRFLFDQQHLRETEPGLVEYSPETTRIFLANRNLMSFSRDLLEKNLGIPTEVVELVPDFISALITNSWTHKNGARLSQRKTDDPQGLRAREAFFSLCTDADLRGCWNTYKKQISSRLKKTGKADWYKLCVRVDKALASKLAAALVRRGNSYKHDRMSESDPRRSDLRMDSLYAMCGRSYEGIREVIDGKKEKERFEDEFAKWLFYVYDPLDCLSAYFKSKRHEGGLRIKKGTASRADEQAVIEEILGDWGERYYRYEESAWIAWLLRFALPETDDPQKRFRKIRSAIINGWFHHVVIDEAQDLSVAEASLLGSFVHERGALTISADFNQVVSPVHGMENPLAFKYGCPIQDRVEDLQVPFTKNMRQTKQITEFLRAFYSNVFKQVPQFVPNDTVTDIVPQLIMCSRLEIPKKIKAIYSVLDKVGKKYSLALLQINEAAGELEELRAGLEAKGVPLAPIWKPFDEPGVLITSSVERVKGLEYDICFILGMDDVERSSLKHSINRSYVALSRPALRLVMFCEKFPKLLKGIDKSLYNVVE
jgi:hypothetical protein